MTPVFTRGVGWCQVLVIDKEQLLNSRLLFLQTTPAGGEESQPDGPLHLGGLRQLGVQDHPHPEPGGDGRGRRDHPAQETGHPR